MKGRREATQVSGNRCEEREANGRKLKDPTSMSVEYLLQLGMSSYLIFARKIH